ncbi:MAG: hypothetical protein UY48_C0011G0036 [Candidatus Gottesmanbacteria bacterium GW2011_GWB1_49_7]|uniref:Uncharacterized protein n=1 Tax=Candidatus Gottesmanbacteria bacterium GW2011_GWB1_49_7 TaxID=1618448 RepID=A0A0G1Z1K7_9BACT|nr:MAG: hypothetical protein UY48_C0011G0036 [Candidatus Gottesmanbacteria bacterium GW2011_GWB1_49_7]
MTENKFETIFKCSCGANLHLAQSVTTDGTKVRVMSVVLCSKCDLYSTYTRHVAITMTLEELR